MDRVIPGIIAVFFGLVSMVSVQPAQAQDGLLKKILNGGKPVRQSTAYRRSDVSPIKRKVIRFDENIEPNTIIVDTSDRRLYYTLGNNKAISYGVGVGREGFTWQGRNKISRKAEWPGWTPPAAMRKREAAKGRILPAYMEGGPENPLGARALYIGSTYYRIHGTNQPWTIGQAMSSGCIRMANNDVKDLYDRVTIGTKVIVRN